jgi:hypothetical protein
MKWKFGSAALSDLSIDKLDHYLSTELERGHAVQCLGSVCSSSQETAFGLISAMSLSALTNSG